MPGERFVHKTTNLHKNKYICKLRKIMHFQIHYEKQVCTFVLSNLCWHPYQFETFARSFQDSLSSVRLEGNSPSLLRPCNWFSIEFRDIRK